MRVADDERARVPFALVGVVLLVTSAGLAATLARREPATVDSRVGEVRHEVTAAARTALVEATEGALRAAARRPVVAPANTSYGRALDGETPFRDALRARLYRRLRASFGALDATRGPVRATVSVPPVDSPTDLRAAVDRVALRGNGSLVRVRVANVTVTVRRGGRVVERATYAPRAAVRSRVLSLHDRVTRFQRRLNESGVEAGLGRRLTARLYALAWTRGYAQYAGAPIANVLGTRHVALATNGAVLDVQRAVFGRSDPRARRAHEWATAAVARADLTGGATERSSDWTDAVLTAARGDRTPSSDVVPPATRARELASAPVRVGVNGSADAALRGLVDDGGLSAAAASVYTAEAWLANRTRVTRSVERAGERPARAELVGVERHTETRSVRVADPTPVASAGHALATYGWRTSTVTRITRRWRTDAGVTETARTENVTRRVTVSVVGSHARSGYAPRRGIDAPHEPGGPLNGRNFAGVGARAVERLVDRRGGPAALYRRARNGTLNETRVTLTVGRPSGLRAWLYRDVARLSDRVRNVSVAVERGALRATNPAAALAERLAERRDALAAVPPRYGSVAAKARVAARRAYLRRVATRLAERTDRVAAADRRVADALATAGAPDANASVLLDPGSVSAANASVTAVRGAPPYLSTSAVAPADAPGVTNRTYPLVARDRNVFAVPYGSVANGVASAVVDRGEGETGLRTAAAVLRGANRTLALRDDAVLATNRSALREAVAAANGRVAAALVSALAATGDSTATATVDEVLSRWEGADGRALAAANGSLGDAVARAATEGVDGVAAARRETAVRAALDHALRAATVPRSAVAPAAERTRALARELLSRGTERALRGAGRAVGRRLGRAVVTAPAGLPVAPVPGFWYATANAWRVTVRGQYQRFAVRAPAGSPAPSPDVTYVREAATVAVDVDGDGERETLGHNRPVAFTARTTVVVVVPPGNTGVGDVDGVRDERSAGWPRPGPTAPTSLSGGPESEPCCTRRSPTPKR